ncbi:hypothetical protein FKM82_028088 [Ascaphus truei]
MFRMSYHGILRGIIAGNTVRCMVRERKGPIGELEGPRISLKTLSFIQIGGREGIRPQPQFSQEEQTMAEKEEPARAKMVSVQIAVTVQLFQ